MIRCACPTGVYFSLKAMQDIKIRRNKELAEAIKKDIINRSKKLIEVNKLCII